MKSKMASSFPGILVGLLALGILLAGTSHAAYASLSAPLLQSDPSETPTLEPPTPTPTSPVFTRPQLVLDGYSSKGPVRPGAEFDLLFRLKNVGGNKARNITVIFSPGDFLPRVNGGLLSAGVISPGASTGYTQPMAASGGLAAGGIGSLSLQVSYTDDEGNGYSDAFTLTLSLGTQPSSSGPIKPTPTPAYRPQLLIIDYETDVETLTPGTQFTLDLEVLNVGGGAARRVTMILGGGSVSAEGTQDSGSGVSGGAGDFSHIAPIKASNVQFVGDVAQQETLTVRQSLIVNSGTGPGAYPLLFSFSYTDEKNVTYKDEQIITLLVYSPPHLELNWYRPLDPFFVGQPGALPVQVVNIGASSVVLGRMTISAGELAVENNTTLVGYLDVGAYFPYDALIFPEQAGQQMVTIEVNYLDDFNQPQVVLQELAIQVEEGFPEDPGFPQDPGFEEPIQEERSFWDKVLAFLRGLLGLGSGQSEGELPPIPGAEGGEMLQ